MSSFKELNGPLGTEFHSFYKLGGDSDTHPCPSLDHASQSNDLARQAHSGESFIPFDQSISQKLTLESCREKGAVQHLRATMPDHTRCIVNATLPNLSNPISFVNKNSNIGGQEQQQSSERRYNTPITNAILQQQQQQTSALNNHRSSPRVIRRYSKPQGDSFDSDTDIHVHQESSVDGDQEDILILKNFQSSVEGTGPARRRSSPDLTADLTGIQFSSLNSNINNSNSTTTNSSSSSSSPDTSSSTAIATAPAPIPTVDYPRQAPTAFPLQSSILGKMVGSRVNIQQQLQQQQQNAENNTLTQSCTSLTPSKSCPKFVTMEDDFHIDIYSVQNHPAVQSGGGAMLPCPPNKSGLIIPSSDSSSIKQRDTNLDSVDSNSSSSSSSSGFGFFSKTRQFGTWLGLSVDGGREKVEISKKDLNVFAPTTF